MKGRTSSAIFPLVEWKNATIAALSVSALPPSPEQACVNRTPVATTANRASPLFALRPTQAFKAHLVRHASLFMSYLPTCSTPCDVFLNLLRPYPHALPNSPLTTRAPSTSAFNFKYEIHRGNWKNPQSGFKCSFSAGTCCSNSRILSATSSAVST